MSTVSVAQSKYESLGVKSDRWAEEQIQFWVNVFTQYSTEQAILHDATNLNTVYSVLSNEQNKIEQERARIQKLLQALAKKNLHTGTFTADEEKLVAALGHPSDPRAYQFASENGRIRVQFGQKDRLENAYSISKRYLKRMEEMFKEEGVPVELTRLPFVESGFVTNVRSSVGAVGIWQFMPRTAQKDLRVDSIIDERRDPLKATRAAARFLKSNYKILGNWGLAIMAYHHGPSLVLKAVRKLKTHDPLEIIKVFKDPSFKFASRNYLFEFLAMLTIDQSHRSFFKDREIMPLPPFITVSFQKKMSISKILEAVNAQLGKRAGVKSPKIVQEDLILLNPHFLMPLWTGKADLPAHYAIRISGISLEEYRKAFP